MARLARENRVMAARAHGGGTIVVLCHSACATLAHDGLGGATRRFALKGTPRRCTCTLPASRWCSATELAPQRCKAIWAAPRWRSAPKIAPRWRTCT